MPMRFVYFASVRELIGVEGEVRELPAVVSTIAECIDYLRDQGPGYKAALADLSRLRFALDQKMAKAHTALAGAEELAIFPPVTGG
jgi:molybdopterin synthase sulfur carrier subunit